ncbi:hypothetical protein FPQ18DRAFT_313086 [Pyronema domesticum]|nr:hypothetical protein FPQ18DRAFT_313086 [Pyronema domesticum]
MFPDLQSFGALCTLFISTRLAVATVPEIYHLWMVPMCLQSSFGYGRRIRGSRNLGRELEEVWARVLGLELWRRGKRNL